VNKRASERIPSSLVVNFILDNSVCYGIATNISEKGMCIKSGNSLPRESLIKLQIPLKKGHLEVPVKVTRVEKASGFYDTMGVELLKPSAQYLKILELFNNSPENA
jgi:hypothetical protein